MHNYSLLLNNYVILHSIKTNKEMKNKSIRLSMIAQLLSYGDYSSQEALMADLKLGGFDLTQGTLSRDLRELRVTKVLVSGGRQVYRLPEQKKTDSMLSSSAATQVPSSIVSINFSGNLAVVHTLPGHASHVASDIDRAHLNGIVGTLAGDDTVLLVLAEDAKRYEVMQLVDEAVGQKTVRRDGE